MVVIVVDLDLLRPGKVIVRGEHRGGRAGKVHQRHEKQRPGRAARRQVHTIEVREGPEGAVDLVAVAAAVLADLPVGHGIGNVHRREGGI